MLAQSRKNWLWSLVHNLKILEFSPEWRPRRKYEPSQLDWNYRYSNSHRVGAVAAAFALDATIEMMQKTALIIDHIILCTKNRGFLTAIDEWKWVYEYDGWMLTRKKSRDFHGADHCPEMQKLLAKLTDLQKGKLSIRVSFRFVRDQDVFEARELAGSAKDMRMRNQDGG
jgi:hypothetical protein